MRIHVIMCLYKMCASSFMRFFYVSRVYWFLHIMDLETVLCSAASGSVYAWADVSSGVCGVCVFLLPSISGRMFIPPPIWLCRHSVDNVHFCDKNYPQQWQCKPYPRSAVGVDLAHQSNVPGPCSVTAAPQRARVRFTMHSPIHVSYVRDILLNT